MRIIPYILACLFMASSCQTPGPEGERWYDDPEYQKRKEREEMHRDFHGMDAKKMTPEEEEEYKKKKKQYQNEDKVEDYGY